MILKREMVIADSEIADPTWRPPKIFLGIGMCAGYSSDDGYMFEDGLLIGGRKKRRPGAELDNAKSMAPVKSSAKRGETAAIRPSSLDGLIGYQLRRAQEASFRSFAGQVGNNDIWPGWFAIMVFIDENPNINQTTLSRLIGRDKSTLTSTLRELIKTDLVQKTEDPRDRRHSRLALTATGRAHLSELQKHSSRHERLINEIVGSSRPELLRVLRDLADALDKCADTAS